MSHCLGDRLEDWITDWHRVIAADGELSNDKRQNAT